ncbi:exodeoxyribonuclease V subunit gamma [Puniceicoccaceae bacterium K14]|nr:exodeoxyribonuclease V subunit gamma [Puniceicoccaceae bacterium K14]
MSEHQFYLHTSNRTERLTDTLLDVVRQRPLPSLIAQETVMVLNPGVARWLQFDIAKKLGVAAGWNFPFTGKVFQTIIEGFFPDFEDSGAFNEASARWQLYQLLKTPETLAFLDFAKDYCKGANGVRVYPLAAKLAALFDEYLVYRPDIILEWETKPKEYTHWLPKLWRRLVKQLYSSTNASPMHIARCWSLLPETKAHTNHAEIWPQRLHIFGVSSLPPLYLDYLKAFSRHRPVHLYLMQPSELYWGDLRTGRQLRKASQRKRSAQPIDDLSAIASPSLLPKWGRQGQAFLDLLFDRDPLHDDSSFSVPSTNSQLQALHSDLFHVLERNKHPQEDDLLPGMEEEFSFPEYDKSIQIHATCSKQRECQVLTDFLIDQFHRNPELRPDDILVMAPNIQDYVAQIKSTFERVDSSKKQIPFSIADRSITASSRMAAALAKLLELPKLRISSLELLEFIEQPAISESFDFSLNDLTTIEIWIREMGTRWGWNTSHRKQFQSQETERDTWKEFRRRLSLGIALSGQDDQIIHGQLPFPHVEGSNAELAGRLLNLLNAIDSVVELYQQTKETSEWSDEIGRIVKRIFRPLQTSVQEIQPLLESLQSLFPNDSYASILGRDAYRCVIDDLLRESPRSGFLNGAVTFCSLKPMRSVPAKVICLIGMNSGAFPRSQTRSNFDIISKSPRPGDRNARDEDKQIFLESALSARETLFISYQNISATSDDPLQPSPLVSQLIDYIQSASISKELITIHKRQAHDQHYFNTESSLFTYNENQASIANAFSTPKRHTQDDKKQIAAPASFSRITIDSLSGFLTAPCKYFQQNICGARNTYDYDPIPEFESITLDGLENYKLHQVYLDELMNSGSSKHINPEALSLKKLLPSGQVSTILDNDLQEELSSLIESHPALASLASTPILQSILEIGGFTLQGSYSLIEGETQILLTPSKINQKGKHILRAWIHHLFANASHSSHTQTLLISTQEPDKPITFSRPADPLIPLESLLELFEIGNFSPLPHFPDQSYKYAKLELSDIEKQGAPLDTEQQISIWNKIRKDLKTPPPAGKDFYSSNAWDSYAEACFGDELTHFQDFRQAALTIWQPILENLNG